LTLATLQSRHIAANASVFRRSFRDVAKGER
jgi:hypothetical protein